MLTPKLMIADIDDTLVSKGIFMSDLTRKTLKRVHENGIWLCIASGRPLDEVETSIGGYDLGFEPEFVVGMNGGEIKDNLSGETIFQHPLQPEMLKTLISLFDKQNCNLDMYKNGQLYAKEMDDMVAASSIRAGKHVHIVQSLSEFWDEPNGKIMFRTDTAETADALETYGNSLHLEGVSFFKTQPNLLEVCDSRVHKGSALQEICRKYGIDLKDVIAFGDASNDNEMLEAAGTGVCLANGLEDTKAIADVVTEKPCAQDGLPLWILENVKLSDHSGL